MNHSLLIIGSGRLGTRVGTLWQGPVTAETMTETRHAELKALGMTPTLRSQHKSPYPWVLFCVPPSKATNSYAEEAARAASLWNEPAGGSLVMISSSAVYEEDAGGTVAEDSPTSQSGRALKLLEAESQVRTKAGASILRLAGLYDEQTGPHLYYARQAEWDLDPNHWINLIHYDDAAQLAVTLLKARRPGIWLGCDGAPITRSQIAAAYAGTEKTAPRFTGHSEELGKKLNNAVTRQVLNWTPQWTSFQLFCDTTKHTARPS